MGQALLWQYDARMPDYALQGCGDCMLADGAARRWVAAGHELSLVIRRPSNRVRLSIDGVIFSVESVATLVLAVNGRRQGAASRNGACFSWSLGEAPQEHWIKCSFTAEPLEGADGSLPAFGFERVLACED